MATSQDILLDTFRDNSAQLITAADMRELINAVYGEKVNVEDVIDNLLSTSLTQPLSAEQGRVLKVYIVLLGIYTDANTVSSAANASTLTGLAGGITTTLDLTTATSLTITNGVITGAA